MRYLYNICYTRGVPGRFSSSPETEYDSCVENTLQTTSFLYTAFPGEVLLLAILLLHLPTISFNFISDSSLFCYFSLNLGTSSSTFIVTHSILPADSPSLCNPHLQNLMRF